MSHHKHKHHSADEGSQAKHESHETVVDTENDLPQQDAAETFKEETPAKTVSVSELELSSLRRELAEAKDKYLRVLAESENARKRLQKEKQETIQYALQNVIVDFLSPIDHMENALNFTQQMSDDVKHWAVGFQMILSQFKDVLSNNGVTPFSSEGKPFDPHRHEAVEAVENDSVPPGTVIEESLKGYIMGDKTIRPARVKVSKASVQEKSDTEEQE
ncbi:MAG TPA: nucleotide exchange factor GrpE [Parachlamydiaceae bacterium]|nr:nucleotide exchange factor GrpE [Parachlamydiaceae bacterium]